METKSFDEIARLVSIHEKLTSDLLGIEEEIKDVMSNMEETEIEYIESVLKTGIFTLNVPRSALPWKEILNRETGEVLFR